MEKRTVIELKDDFRLRLKIDLIEEEIDLDRITSIDIANLSAEIVTIPVLLNQFGILLAEATAVLQERKMEFEIFVAKQKEKIRLDALNIVDKIDEDEEEEVEEKTSNKGRKKVVKKVSVKKLTNDEIETKILQLPIYAIKKKHLISAEKNVSLLNSAFWSLKDKSGKIDKLSMSITQGDVFDHLISTSLEKMNYVDLKLIKPKLQ